MLIDQACGILRKPTDRRFQLLIVVMASVLDVGKQGLFHAADIGSVGVFALLI
jgi:hypothetical protein